MTTVIFQSLGAAVGGAIAGPTGAAIGSAIGAMGRCLCRPATFRSPMIARLSDRAWRAHKFCPPREGASNSPDLRETADFWRDHLGPRGLLKFKVLRPSHKGGKGGGSKTQVRSYSYFANFAIGLCKGEIAKTGRIWGRWAADRAVAVYDPYATRAMRPSSQTV